MDNDHFYLYGPSQFPKLTISSDPMRIAPLRFIVIVIIICIFTYEETKIQKGYTTKAHGILGNLHRCPSIDQWIKRTWYVDKVEYYSAIERKF